MSWIVPIPERGRGAWNAFQAALRTAGAVPCADRIEWISESADDRSYAVGHCGGCPILAECGTASTAIGMKVGVWGGQDRTPGTKQITKNIPLFDQEESA